MPLSGITASLKLRTIFPMDRLPSSLSAKASWDALAFSLCATDASLLARSLDDSFVEEEAIIATFLKSLGPPDVCPIDALPPTNQERSIEQTPTSTMQTPASIVDESATLTRDAVATIYAIVINGFVTTHLNNPQQWDVLAITNHLSLHIVWYGNYMPSHTTALSSPFHDTTIFISLLATDRESTSYPPAIDDLNTHPHIRTAHGALLLSADYYKWPCGPMRWKLLHIAILAPITTASRPFACAFPISSNQAGSFFTPDKVLTIFRQMCIAYAITEESEVNSFMKAPRLLNVIYEPVTTYSSLDYSLHQCLIKVDKWTLDTTYQHFCRCRCPTHLSSKYNSQELINNTIVNVIQRYFVFPSTNPVCR
ncbi:hypothetical protein KP509_19G011600 [Ceratopteris richardii]|uniref:Uncharacterized protein n=1 Tax=Ceratopteris richardii TaxID=49495 RepID=A0A8T2SIQ1_CERRI|nr:hypothetical protein KP509_19G011600 [Ceratopteris richardii]